MSYLLFALTTVHMLAAGTDARSILASTAAVLIGTVAVFGSAATWLWRSDPETTGVRRRRVTRPHASSSARPIS